MKMKQKVFGLIAIACASSVNASLLVNPSFELPAGVGYAALPGGSTAITGWTTFLSGVEWYNATGYGGAADGVMVVDLANYVYSNGGIQQTFVTTPGQTYSVSFSAGNYLGFGRDGTGVVQVDVAGMHFDFDTAIATTASDVWKSIDFDFTAIDTATILAFSNTQNSFTHFALIDGIGVIEKGVAGGQVAAVPEPATIGLILAGLAVAGFSASRRQLAN